MTVNVENGVMTVNLTDLDDLGKLSNIITETLGGAK